MADMLLPGRFRLVTVAVDPAWGMTGWAVCTKDGPDSAGRVALTGDHQWEKLRRLVQLVRDRAEAAAEQLRASQPLPVYIRCVIEDAPLKYARPSAATRGTSTAAAATADRRTLRQTAKVGGAFGTLFLGADDGEHAVEPMFLEPDDWRGFWQTTRGRSASRTQVKAWAMGTVERMWPRAYASLAVAGDAGLEDVSEAILMGVGAARRLEGTGMARPATWTPRPRPAYPLWGLDWGSP